MLGVGSTLRLTSLLAIADDPGDDDDTRRRKRVGVAASSVTVFVPFLLPVQSNTLAIAWPLAIILSAFNVANLVLLARTRDFDRFVGLLLTGGVLFVPAADFVGGGILGPTTGLGWAFLIPAYAILALGPRRALRWFFVYLAVVLALAALDPLARSTVPAQAYGIVLLGQIQNTVIPLTVVFLLFRYTDLRRLAAEARVDELLTNAIPAEIAKRLRGGERRIAESYPATTILFADVVGFTPWAQRTPPDRVVDVLDRMFSAFDDLTERHGLEKIKTIGDAYMAVAGAPRARADHAMAALELARAMIASTAELGTTLGVDLEIRIGLASGPVVGGVIGQRRLLFDLWGDTVNLAARLESTGIPGRIQLAASTRDLLGDAVACEPREIDVKGLGRLTTFLLAEAAAGPG